MSVFPAKSPIAAIGLLLAALFLLPTPKASAQTPAADAPSRTKSWISIGESRKGAIRTPGDAWTEGDDWLVTVEYFLDPSEATPDSQLQLIVLGPWVDNPDGKYTTKRGEQRYGNLGGTIPVKPGAKAKHEFAMKLPAAKTGTGVVGDDVSFLATFRSGGKAWPWSVRGPGVWFARKGGFFELAGKRPGNFFYYDEPVVMQAALKGGAIGGGARELRYNVIDTTGQSVLKGAVPFTPAKEGQVVPIPLALKAPNQRGTFGLEVTVDGWETRSVSFARIPNVLAVTGGAKTRLGVTVLAGPKSDSRAADQLTIARTLGFTSCRAWLKWDEVEPAEGEWRDLEGWDKGLDLAREKGIEPWLLLESPPKWAVAGAAKNFSYTAFPFRDEQLRKTVSTLGQRFKGKILGWEWLNEITPGNVSPDPVADYLRFCKVATEAAKAADPKVITTLAGGLWPRSFRRSLLAAGVAKYIDVLPIHYADGDGVREARRDLDEVGAKNVRVWDNESAAGLSTWNMPLAEALQIKNQSEWILARWTDELMAGADRSIYFGGAGAAAGNWTYLWADLSPRPVAATLAVFAAKTFGVKPVGIFTLNDHAVFHLFEKADGQALLVAGWNTAEGGGVTMQTGSPAVTITDHQGNEQTVPGRNGKVVLPLPDGHVFVEGADLETMKAQVVPQLQGGSDTPDPRKTPQMQMLAGQPAQCIVRLRNVFAHEISGQVKAELPALWAASPPVPFRLAPGAESIIQLALPVPPASATGLNRARVVTLYESAKLPAVSKDLLLSVVAPEMLGNLLKNGGLEEGGKPESAAAWNGTGKRVAADGPDLGHGAYVWRFENSGTKFLTLSQGRAMPAGGKFLYTAWVKTHEMPAGSNVNLEMADGTKKTLTDVKVFRTPPNQQDWEVITAIVNTPENLKQISVTPLARGAGWALFDNLRLTSYEGTDFAAEARKLAKPVKVDGNLDDWDLRDPIPLIGKNQLHPAKPTYVWSPQNGSGVAYVRWDAGNLYLAAEILDDRHTAAATNEDTIRDDSLIVALHPANRLAGEDAKAFAYYLSAARPGGGSGVHTLYRPPAKSGGLAAGSLAKDSSIYELSIQHRNGRTIYEMRLPNSELGGIRGALGAKVGLSLQLNDNDGAGLEATLNWGGGLAPSWSPSEFGVLTFVE